MIISQDHVLETPSVHRGKCSPLLPSLTPLSLCMYVCLSLLDILADRKNRRHVSGHVFVGKGQRGDDFTLQNGYCTQDDVLMGRSLSSSIMCVYGYMRFMGRSR